MASNERPEIAGLSDSIEKYDRIYIGYPNWNADLPMPVYGSDEEVEKYNVFRVEMLIRHAEDGKMYLYDLVNIKKETSTPLEQ